MNLFAIFPEFNSKACFGIRYRTLRFIWGIFATDYTDFLDLRRLFLKNP